MGRLSNFISKTGNIVQRAADETQMPRQPQPSCSPQAEIPQGNPLYYNQHTLQCAAYQTPAPQTSRSHQPQQTHVSMQNNPPISPQHQQPYPDRHNYQPQLHSSGYPNHAPHNQQITHNIVTLPSGLCPITECPNSPIAFGLDWFINGSAPGFLVCSRCYADYIFSSQFSNSFTQIYLPGGKSRMCLFNAPRVRKLLWPHAQASSDMRELLDYMKMRAELPFCPEGNVQVKKSWYVAVERPELSFCPSCFEDKIRSGPFEAHFRAEIREDPRSCHNALWSIRRTLDRCSQFQNWQEFIIEASQRLQITACPKAELVIGQQRIWFVSSRGPDGFQICEACFWDYFRANRDAWSFQTKRLGNHEQAVCLMSQMNFLVPITKALEVENLEIFWEAAKGISENPLCTAKGMSDARWYTIDNDPPEFDICGACFAGIVRPLGLEPHFHPKAFAGPTGVRLCNLNVQGFWRALVYLEKLLECAYLDSPEPMKDFAIRMAYAPACPKVNRQQAQKNLRWWGWNDVHICEECYNISIKGSSLESHFHLRGQDITEPRICDMFSGQMRSRYHAACETNNAADFLEFARQRRVTYFKTMPECDRLLQQAKFALSQAQTLGLAAVTFSAAGNLTDTTWGHSYTVGNSVVGHGYANEQLMNAAVADYQMQITGAAAVGPAAIARVGILEKMWKIVE